MEKTSISIKPVDNGFTVSTYFHDNRQELVFESVYRMLDYICSLYGGDYGNRTVKSIETCIAMSPEEMRDEIGLLRKENDRLLKLGKDISDRHGKVQDALNAQIFVNEQLHKQISKFAVLNNKLMNKSKPRKR